MVTARSDRIAATRDTGANMPLVTPHGRCMRIDRSGSDDDRIPDSKVHGADPDGPYAGPMNLAIWDGLHMFFRIHARP